MPSQGDPHVEVTVDAEVELPPDVTEDALTSLSSYVLRAEGVPGNWQLGIRFVDDPTMQQAHIDFMGIDTPTDIMTFPYEDDGFGELSQGDDDFADQGGDLMISVDRAADHARDAGWSTGEELLFVVIHGILHILGWDDATDADRTRMLDRQLALLHGWTEGR